MSILSKPLIVGVILGAALLAVPNRTLAQSSLIRPPNSNEPGWEGRVLLFGEERTRIKSMPIEQRPNRTGHFYGNTVRRIYYRGMAMPLPRDFVNMTYAFIRER